MHGMKDKNVVEHDLDSVKLKFSYLTDEKEDLWRAYEHPLATLISEYAMIHLHMQAPSCRLTHNTQLNKDHVFIVGSKPFRFVYTRKPKVRSVEQFGRS